MEETRNADVEIEVAFELANHFEASGDKARARALYEDVSLRQPEGTYGRLAATRARLLAFGEKHSALFSEGER
jgi:hypothetical protein